MDTGGVVLVVLNGILALGFGWPLAVLFSRLAGRREKKTPVFCALMGVYLAEALAFSASMATSILSLGLALVWGFVLGSRLPKSPVPPGHWAGFSRLAALYTSLPAASFLAVPVVAAIGGWEILGAEEGAQFGIPGFLPWPFKTILGFCVLVSGFAVTGKVVLTTSVAGAIIRRSKRERM